MQKGELRHVGIVVKNLNKAVHTYCNLGFHVMEREIIKVVKMQDDKGNVFELVKGKWKNHIAVNFYEDSAGNLVEVVCQSKS